MQTREFVIASGERGFFGSFEVSPDGEMVCAFDASSAGADMVFFWFDNVGCCFDF